MKSLLFRGEVCDRNSDRESNFKKVGLNTGNLLFWYALSHILNVDAYSLEEYSHGIRSGNIDPKEYVSFITTDLIWIQPDRTFPHVWKELESAGDKPLIPISVGLQNSSYDAEFKMNPDTVRLLQVLQERCVLGVRGHYSAEILNSKGIKNIHVIGCPSLYLPFNRAFKMIRKGDAPERVAVNMRTLYSRLTKPEVVFLTYAARKSFDFVEQTNYTLSEEKCPDLETFGLLNDWMNARGRVFFDVEDWRAFSAAHDFSMGCRFHGNVINLWESVPALFFPIDSRTMEMCDLFKLPVMKLGDFDPNRDIRFYYEKADYTEFNKDYPGNLDTFVSFLNNNHIPIKREYQTRYEDSLTGMKRLFNRIIRSLK